MSKKKEPTENDVPALSDEERHARNIKIAIVLQQWERDRALAHTFAKGKERAWPDMDTFKRKRIEKAAKLKERKAGSIGERSSVLYTVMGAAGRAKPMLWPVGGMCFAVYAANNNWFLKTQIDRNPRLRRLSYLPVVSKAEVIETQPIQSNSMNDIGTTPILLFCISAFLFVAYFKARAKKKKAVKAKTA